MCDVTKTNDAHERHHNDDCRGNDANNPSQEEAEATKKGKKEETHWGKQTMASAVCLPRESRVYHAPYDRANESGLPTCGK